MLLEVSGRTGIAMTPDGRFVRVRCGYGDREGQEVRISTMAPARAGWRFRPSLAAAVFAVFLALLSPMAIGRVLASGEPVAYVTLDINPSVEFGVNRWDRVVSATPLNSDGAEILAELDWRGRLLADVVEDATVLASNLGFLSSGGGEVVVTAVPAALGQGIPPGLERQMARVREALQERLGAEGEGLPGVTVETIITDAASMREEAARLGLSVGRYAILLAAQETGLDLDSEDLETGIGKAIIDAGGHPGEVLREAHLNRKLSKLAEKFQRRNGVGTGGEAGGDPGDDSDDDEGDDPDDPDEPANEGKGNGNGHGDGGNGIPNGGSGPAAEPGDDGSGDDSGDGRATEPDGDDRDGGDGQGEPGHGEPVDPGEVPEDGRGGEDDDKRGDDPDDDDSDGDD